MTILFDATRSVKTTKNFGRGILRSVPNYRRTWSAADEAWLIEDNARREAFDRLIDREYAESRSLDCLTAGLIPSDLAAEIASTWIGGHDA